MKFEYTLDTRPNCTTDLEEKSPTGSYEEYLLCLKMDEPCENTMHADEVKVGALQVAIIKALVAIVIANPVQFAYELLFIYLVKFRVKE